MNSYDKIIDKIVSRMGEQKWWERPWTVNLPDGSAILTRADVTPGMRRPFAPIVSCDEIVRHYPCPPIAHTEEFGGPGYIPSEDRIVLPPPANFCNPEAYYCTLFHELIHSTGHPSRLARKGILEGSNSEDCAQEELIAGLGAAFLCAHASIEEKIIDNIAAYLNDWADRWQEAIDWAIHMVHAQVFAETAAEYILNEGRLEGIPNGASNELPGT